MQLYYSLPFHTKIKAGKARQGSGTIAVTQSLYAKKTLLDNIAIVTLLAGVCNTTKTFKTFKRCRRNFKGQKEILLLDFLKTQIKP